MANSDLILFFKNLNKLTSFERKKKIYDLTNGLDPYLLYDLKREAHRFYEEKIDKRHINSLKKSKNPVLKEFKYVPKSHTKIFEHKFDFFKNEFMTNSVEELNNSYLNHLINEIIAESGFELIGDIIEESADFLFELSESIARAKTLTKNIEAFASIKSEEAVDYSDTIIIDKIIFLEKLGVIDFLKKEIPFNTSTNKLATVLSAITGAGASSIQPMLNPLVNNDIENKNNPMKSKKRVQITVNKLINIGYNPK